MLVDSTRITKILVKYNLDIYQFWLLYLRATNDYQSLHAYCETFGLFPTDKAEALEERGLIKPLGYTLEDGKKRIKFLDVFVTDHCIETFFKDCNVITEEIGEELFRVYPKFIDIQGKRTVSTMAGSINGVWYDKDKCIEVYLKKIKFDEDLHRKIINTVVKAKEQNLINFTFRNFVNSELWENLFDIVKLEEEDKQITKVRTI